MRRPRTETGIVGVQGPYLRERVRVRKTGVFTHVEHYFQATWQQNGVKKKAQFSIRHYGRKRAFALAKHARETGWK